MTEGHDDEERARFQFLHRLFFRQTEQCWELRKKGRVLTYCLSNDGRETFFLLRRRIRLLVFVFPFLSISTPDLEELASRESYLPPPGEIEHLSFVRHVSFTTELD